jgi:phosphatidylglycerophosphate synthase
VNTTPRPVLLVLLPGPDARLLGLSVRTRNTRVATRHGATVATPEELATADESSVAVLVPPSVAITRALFPLPAIASATWLESEGTHREQRAVLAGPPRQLQTYVSDARHPSMLPRHALREGALLDVSSRAARRRAGWWLLRQTRKPTDGWIARNFNRPVSQAISYVALHLGCSATLATWVALIVGVVSAAIGTQPGWPAFAAAGVLFHLASVLDGVDGEIARTTLTESERGGRFDAAVDRITAFACFAGVTVGWIREGAGINALVWTAVVATGLALSLAHAFRLVARDAPGAPLLIIDRAINRAARESGALMLRLAARSFALLRRDLFAVIFMVVGFTGVRALVPALVAVGLVIANVTFWLYGRELAAAVRAERAA